MTPKKSSRKKTSKKPSKTKKKVKEVSKNVEEISTTESIGKKAIITKKTELDVPENITSKTKKAKSKKKQSKIVSKDSDKKKKKTTKAEKKSSKHKSSEKTDKSNIEQLLTKEMPESTEPKKTEVKIAKENKKEVKEIKETKKPQKELSEIEILREWQKKARAHITKLKQKIEIIEEQEELWKNTAHEIGQHFANNFGLTLNEVLRQFNAPDVSD